MSEDYRLDCTDRLAIRLAAGVIKRWHTVPIHGEQTVADHTYRVVQILRYIEPVPSKQLLCAALDHDVAEAKTGDIPFSQKTKDAIALEKEVLKKYDIAPTLEPYEAKLLKVADMLEMGYFAMQQHDMGNVPMGYILRNVVEALDEYCNLNDRVSFMYTELVEYLEAIHGSD